MTYPDAYNKILYSDTVSSENSSLELKFQKSVKDCHFYLGLLNSDLKDELGYNHNSPLVCLLCGHSENPEYILEFEKTLQISSTDLITLERTNKLLQINVNNSRKVKIDLSQHD